MKYGSELASRSIPEWAYHNVNYDSLKQMIKQHTIVQAIPVPTNSNSPPQINPDPDPNFTKELYAELSEEYGRVELFVRSKFTELEARFSALSRRVSALTTRYKPAPRSSIPFRLLERLSLLEGEMLEAGVLLRKLSRFIVAQRTAFIKLLKKYVRWYGNAAMPARFRRTYIDKTGETRYLGTGSLDSHLEWWLALLTDLRSLVLPSGSTYNPLKSVSHNTAALPVTVIDEEQCSHALPRLLLLPTMDSENVTSNLNLTNQLKLQRSITKESLRDVLEFDLAFDNVMSLNDASKCAVYWVHPDNLIELQVLLNNHFSTIACSSPGSIRPAQSRADSRVGILPMPRASPSRHPSSSSLPSSGSLRDSEMQWTNCLAVDNPARFGSESLVSVVGTARWMGQGEAVFSLRQVPKNRRESFPMIPLTSRLKEKLLPCLLNTSQPFLLPSPSSLTSASFEASSHDQHVDELNSIRHFLEDNSAFGPLACSRSRRTRYVGLNNIENASIFATLDQSILLGDVRSWLQKGHQNHMPDITSLPTSPFPFAVLSVRSDGMSASRAAVTDSIIQLLDSSHLSYKVDGFNILTHAIWTQCQPRRMVIPSWISMMDTDIRVSPSDNLSDKSPLTSLRISSAKGRHGRFPTLPSALPSHRILSQRSSTTDETIIASPSMSLPSHNGTDHALSSSVKQGRTNASMKPAARYWSEYDNPDDLSGSDDGGDAYVIYIDPDEPSFFDFSVSSWVQKTYRKLIPSSSRITLDDCDAGEGADSPATNEYSNSDAVNSPRRQTASGHHVHLLNSDGDSQPISALLNHLTSAHLLRIRSKLFLSFCCVLASVMLSTASLVLVASSRRKLRARIDEVVIFCVIVSSFFAISGFIYGLSYIMELARSPPPSLVVNGDLSDANRDLESRSPTANSVSFTSPSTNTSGIVWRSVLFFISVTLTVSLNVMCVFWALSSGFLDFNSSHGVHDSL